MGSLERLMESTCHPVACQTRREKPSLACCSWLSPSFLLKTLLPGTGVGWGGGSILGIRGVWPVSARCQNSHEMKQSKQRLLGHQSWEVQAASQFRMRALRKQLIHSPSACLGQRSGSQSNLSPGGSGGGREGRRGTALWHLSARQENQP